MPHLSSCQGQIDEEFEKEIGIEFAACFN